MRVDKILSFVISEDEMQELLAGFIETHKGHRYGEHVRRNAYDLDFIDGEWVLSVDGMLEDK